MKSNNIVTLLLGGLLCILHLVAHAEVTAEKQAESKVVRFSKHSGVMEFDPNEGFKMREPALATMGIRFQKLKGPSPWTLSSNALVHIKHTAGVYRRVDGWISFVLVKVKARTDSKATLESEDLESGDEIATEGATFLRMTESDLNSDTVDNCSH